MANLNLSEFGEKLFVADADHTFIWDTANAISKRVSRNSWLNSGTLTSDAPVTISQTWNNAAVAFTGLKVNATSTNSAAASLLLDLQTGGVSKASFNKDGSLTIGGGNISDGGFGFLFKGFGVGSFFVGQNGSGSGAVALGSSSSFGFSSLGTPTGLTLDTILLRDAANTLALRNGAAAQTFNVYGTWTTAITNFERLAIKYNTTDLAYQIAAEKGTTNGDYRPLQLWTGGASRLHVSTAGNVGIGTTSPTSKIDVEGSARLGGVANIDRTAGTLANIISLQARGAAESSNFGNPLGNGAGEISENGLSGLIIGTRSTASVVLGTSNTERMRILAVSGNVAIGATAAASKLTVTSGDVEVATIASGLILKSPDGTRYRVTVPNGGASLTITAV